MLLVMDEYTYSKVGVEVILDLSAYQDFVHVRRVVDHSPDGELIKQLLPKEVEVNLILPALCHVTAEGKFTLLRR